MGILYYLKDIKNDIRYHGHAYVMTDILFKIFAFFIWAPIASWFFNYLLGLYGSAAVSNTDIIGLILSPLGVLSLFVGSLGLLTLFFAEHAVLMAIAFASQKERKIHWFGAFSLLKQKIKPLIIWGGSSIFIAILTLIPIFLGLLFLYAQLISLYDINYYLQERPKEFIQFLSMALPLLILALLLSGYLYISWLFALPIILFEPKQGLMALVKTTYSRLYGRFWHIVFTLLLWWAILLMAAFLYQFVIEDILANTLFKLNTHSPKWVFSVMSIMFFLEIAFDSLWQLVAIIGTVVIFVQIYSKEFQSDFGKIAPLSSSVEKFSFSVKLHYLWGFAIVTILVIAVSFSYNLSRSFTKEDKVNIIAHRGASSEAPPNSRSAFLQAIKDGADYIELDVQETKDGIVIVHHDKDYKLSSNINKGVHELTWAEAQHIDIGESFSPAFKGEKVISLQETLALAKGKINLLIELKYYGYNQQLEERVLALVVDAGMQDNVRYMSLNLEAMQKLKKLQPSARVGYISSAATIGDLSRINLDFIAVSSSLASRNFVKRTQKNSKNIGVWTIDDVDMMMRFLDLQVNDIITNKPSLLRAVLDERKNMSKADLLISFYYHYWENTRGVLGFSH